MKYSKTFQGRFKDISTQKDFANSEKFIEATERYKVNQRRDKFYWKTIYSRVLSKFFNNEIDFKLQSIINKGRTLEYSCIAYKIEDLCDTFILKHEEVFIEITENEIFITNSDDIKILIAVNEHEESLLEGMRAGDIDSSDPYKNDVENWKFITNWRKVSGEIFNLY